MGRRVTGSACLLTAAALLVLVAVASSTTPIDAADAAPGAELVLSKPAQAYAPATRGEQVRVGPAPGGPACERVAVIGDSLTDNARWLLDGALDDAGFVSVIDAQPSRRIPASVAAPYSGVRAAVAVRATWGEADCWVIALGSNDLIFGGGTRQTAAAMIDEMLAAVTPGSRVWWVNVDYHLDPRTSFDFVGATSVFNSTLDQRASLSSILTVIDWYSLAEAHLEWFFDPVHVTTTGSRARVLQLVDALFQ